MNTDNICFLRFWRVEDGLDYNCDTNYITSSQALFKHQEMGLVFSYVLCQQSSFEVEESCLSITSYTFLTHSGSI